MNFYNRLYLRLCIMHKKDKTEDKKHCGCYNFFHVLSKKNIFLCSVIIDDMAHKAKELHSVIALFPLQMSDMQSSLLNCV